MAPVMSGCKKLSAAFPIPGASDGIYDGRKLTAVVICGLINVRGFLALSPTPAYNASSLAWASEPREHVSSVVDAAQSNSSKHGIRKKSTTGIITSSIQRLAEI